jgi:hypothetical protein
MADTCCNHDCEQGRLCPRRNYYTPGRLAPLTPEDMEAGQRALHTEDGGTWFLGHRVLRLHHDAAPTGWPPGLLQDEPDCSPAKGNRARSLSKWLATTPDARLHAREAAAAMQRKPTESATERSDTLGWIALVLAAAAALAVVLSQLPI